MYGTRAIPIGVSAVVVVRKGDRFLLVHERKQANCGICPQGESNWASLSHRCLPRDLGGDRGAGSDRWHHRVEHSRLPREHVSESCSLPNRSTDTPPKSKPDDESLEAAWVSLDELVRYPLRGEEVLELFAYVAAGGPVYPASLLQSEGMPYQVGK